MIDQLFSVANLEQQIDMNPFLFTFVNKAKLQLFKENAIKSLNAINLIGTCFKK